MDRHKDWRHGGAGCWALKASEKTSGRKTILPSVKPQDAGGGDWLNRRPLEGVVTLVKSGGLRTGPQESLLWLWRGKCDSASLPGPQTCRGTHVCLGFSEVWPVLGDPPLAAGR